MREILILPNVFLALRLCGPVDNDQGPVSRIGGDGADKPDYAVSLEPLPVKGNAPMRARDVKKQLFPLFQTTVPLFASLFLMNVMANLSKYVVNYYENSTAQGYFNILFFTDHGHQSVERVRF